MTQIDNELQCFSSYGIGIQCDTRTDLNRKQKIMRSHLCTEFWYAEVKSGLTVTEVIRNIKDLLATESTFFTGKKVLSRDSF